MNVLLCCLKRYHFCFVCSLDSLFDVKKPARLTTVSFFCVHNISSQLLFDSISNNMQIGPASNNNNNNNSGSSRNIFSGRVRSAPATGRASTGRSNIAEIQANFDRTSVPYFFLTIVDKFYDFFCFFISPRLKRVVIRRSEN